MQMIAPASFKAQRQYGHCGSKEAVSAPTNAWWGLASRMTLGQRLPKGTMKRSENTGTSLVEWRQEASCTMREPLHKPPGKRPLRQYSGKRVMEADGICPKSGEDTVTDSYEESLDWLLLHRWPLQTLSGALPF